MGWGIAVENGQCPTRFCLLRHTKETFHSSPSSCQIFWTQAFTGVDLLPTILKSKGQQLLKWADCGGTRCSGFWHHTLYHTVIYIPMSQMRLAWFSFVTFSCIMMDLYCGFEAASGIPTLPSARWKSFHPDPKQQRPSVACTSWTFDFMHGRRCQNPS